MTCVGLYLVKSALVASGSLRWSHGREKRCKRVRQIRSSHSPKISILRAREDPCLAVAPPIPRVWGLSLEDVLDGLSDKAVATCDENDVGRVVHAVPRLGVCSGHTG